jgi:acetyl-CoA carboxylase biotin carboxyl carrier protein
MRHKKIKKIIRLFEKTDISKLELEFKHFKITLEKPGSFASNFEPKLQSTESVPDLKKKGTWIVSPLVGTFYDAPNLIAKPFVSIGDEVKENDVLCVIEAMKIMNELRSDIRGRVVEIAVKSQSMVQYNQPLFRILEHD